MGQIQDKYANKKWICVFNPYQLSMNIGILMVSDISKFFSMFFSKLKSLSEYKPYSC